MRWIIQKDTNRCAVRVANLDNAKEAAYPRSLFSGTLSKMLKLGKKGE
jgi:hypothetical protein